MKEKTICKKALVLGATGGIGSAVARQLAGQVEELEILGPNQERLEHLTVQLQARAATVTSCVLDLEDLDQVRAFAQNLQADLVINCCGLAYFGEETGLAEADEERLWKVNYLAPLALMKEAMRKQQELTFVQLSSLAALLPHPYMAAYSASKSALHTACLSLQEEARQQDRLTQIQLLVLGPTATGILPKGLSQKLGGARMQLSPDSAARKILRAVQKGKSYAVIGNCYRLLASLIPFLPQRLKVRILGSYLKRGIER